MIWGYPYFWKHPWSIYLWFSKGQHRHSKGQLICSLDAVAFLIPQLVAAKDVASTSNPLEMMSTAPCGGKHGWLWHLTATYGGFPKWWYLTTIGFPTKNDPFGVFWGYHHVRKHPYVFFQCIHLIPLDCSLGAATYHSIQRLLLQNTRNVLFLSGQIYHHTSFNPELKSSWWFQPIWKILVKLDHFPN